MQRALVGTVAEHFAEGIGLKHDAIHQAFDVIHVAPFETLAVAKQIGDVIVADQIALLQLHEKAD